MQLEAQTVLAEFHVVALPGRAADVVQAALLKAADAELFEHTQGRIVSFGVEQEEEEAAQ